MQLTKADVVKYITTIRIMYTNAYVTKSDYEYDILVETWLNVLSWYPKEIVDKAFGMAISNSEFYPKPATIVAEIERIRTMGDPDPAALWDGLMRQLGRVAEISSRLKSTYIPQHSTITQGQAAQKELEQMWSGLDTTIKAFCGSTHTLIEWANMDYEQLGFEKGRFLKSVPVTRDKGRAAEQFGLAQEKPWALQYPQQYHSEMDYRKLETKYGEE